MFDPALPAAHSTNSSAEMRGQLNSPKAEIDALTAQVASLQGQLNAAIAGTAQNIPGVSTLNLTISNNPPQQSDVQPIADKVDQLIHTLPRHLPRERCAGGDLERWEGDRGGW